MPTSPTVNGSRMQKSITKGATLLAALVTLALLSHHECHQSSPISESYSAPHYDPYSYGYDVEDYHGNKQWRQERSNNPQEVHGSYGYRDKSGVYREVVYVADKNGFRANIKTNEPGVAGTKDPASVKMEQYHSPSFASTAAASVPVYSSRHIVVPSYH